MRTLPPLALAVLAIVLAGCHAQKDTGTPAAKPIASRAEDVQPLRPGERAPAAILQGADGQAVDLDSLYAAGPTLLIFYRGGWCPYCNTHLAAVGKHEPDLKALGYQILAISPDRPEELQKSIAKQQLSYRLLSDADMTLSRAFGLAFRVDDPTLAKYRGYGIDLEKSSGLGHHLLPVPAVYIIDTQGVIRFAHWNPDYKKRLEGPELLAAAKAAQAR